MLFERPLDPAVKELLLSHEAFQYCHLIKFERPSRPDSNSGQVSTSKQRYTYLTDASRDIEFNDGSLSSSGAANGTQTYIANKVLSVSSVQEDTEAKASSYTLTLDGNGLGAFIPFTNSIIANVSPTTWDVTLPTSVDLIAAGFREGDKISLSGSFQVSANIVKFRAPNVIRVSRIDSNIPVGSATLSVSLSSDEIVSILLDKNADSYASFINREVFIYRAYFQDGTIVGAPFLLFKGIISGVAFDDGDNGLTVTWSMTSHWGDFSQVKGRITSDDFHRALDQNGTPQPQSALKISYAYDKGFAHAETSINILAQYSVQVEKQDVSVKKGFLGIGSKVKVKKYYVSEGRNTQLDFQLQAKSIPVIYGVRNTEGIPVFADTLQDDSSTVYVAEVLSEGEIGGVYDTYIEGNSLICNDKADFDTRSIQTDSETVQLICRGRADRGDVLGGTVSTIPAVQNDFYDYYSHNPGVPYRFMLDYDLPYLNRYPKYVEPAVAVADTTGAGIIDGQSINLSSPQNITLDVFSGKPGQKAAASLVSIARANNFKIQNSYWNGTDTADYWSPNHRLLDTAYIIGKYKIEEGETSIPATEYIVRGKVVDCYNYDRSYTHNPRAANTEDANNFNLGDFVDLKKLDGTVLNANVQIIDKWTFCNSDGTANTRFRFSSQPNLSYSGGIPTLTKFRMTKGSSTWEMITFNHKELEGTVPAESISTVTGAVNSNGYVQFNFSSNASFIVGGDPSETSGAFSVTDVNGFPTENLYFGYSVLIGAVTSTNLTTKYSWAATGPAATQTVGRSIVQRNVIALPASASSVANYYNGCKVTLTRVDANTGKITVQQQNIIAYNGSSKLATIDGLWDYGYHPKPGDTIALTPAYADSRVTINTAMQLMDYVTSKTYGRGLDPFKDLNFQSWLESAQACDEQSNVTTQSTGNSSAQAGVIYRWPANGQPLLWQGTVVGTDGPYTEFTSVIGKLSNKWNNWKSFKLNELVYHEDRLYKVTQAGVKTAAPIHAAGSFNGLEVINSPVLYKRGDDSAQLSLIGTGNPVRSFRNGSIIPGYSLYDCDGVDYWRMLGWDEFNQRYVTRHQTNLIIDTSQPLLDNVNSFLEHFGGILRYSGGQYYLEVEQPSDLIEDLPNEVRNVTADHIIGKIRLTDEGIRSAYNSLTASYADPANKFESRNISFFNSEYLKADKNVSKKGNITVPGITNYYNTRLLADRSLNKSRFGLTISFNMAPRGAILLAGKVIQIQYPRYNWENKKFRITSLAHHSDATVDIVAEEYDDSFYGLSKISKQAASGLAGNTGSVTGIGAPFNLQVSNIDSGDETNSAISLTWTNNPAANSKNVYTEIFSSYSSHLYLELNSIASNTITTMLPNHELQVGEQITSLTRVGGMEQNKTYFVKSVPAANKFQLSETKGGPILPLISGPYDGYFMQSAQLTATVPIPTASYVDVFGGIDDRVVKYYWIRHKVVQVT